MRHLYPGCAGDWYVCGIVDGVFSGNDSRCCSTSGPTTLSHQLQHRAWTGYPNLFGVGVSVLSMKYVVCWRSSAKTTDAGLSMSTLNVGVPMTAQVVSRGTRNSGCSRALCWAIPESRYGRSLSVDVDLSKMSDTVLLVSLVRPSQSPANPVQ